MPAVTPPYRFAQVAREKAVVLERVGRYREAAHCWHLMLADAPDDAKTLCSLAHVYLRLNKRWRAGEYVAQALAADPNCERAHRINCLLVLGKGKKAAVASALRAVELSPTGRYAWSLLVRSYLANGETQKARDAVLQLGRLAPAWSTSYLLLGEVALRMEKYQAAEKAARSALAIDAESFDAHVLLGHALCTTQNFHEAANAFLCALKLRPESDSAGRLLIFSVWGARRTFRLSLDMIPFAIGLMVCLWPALHFPSWKACVAGFLVWPVIGTVKLLKNRVPLSPEVEAAYRAERVQMVKAFFRRARRLWEAVE